MNGAHFPCKHTMCGSVVHHVYFCLDAAIADTGQWLKFDGEFVAAGIIVLENAAAVELVNIIVGCHTSPADESFQLL